MSIDVSGKIERVGYHAIEDLIRQDVCKSGCYHESAPSTNTLAINDLRDQHISDDQFPRLYLADKQLDGRGRHGRSWESNENTLTFSLTIAWPMKQHPLAHQLPIAVGVGIARGIEFQFAPLKTRLKWPNDLYIDGGKVAGVLIETHQNDQEHAVVGVGVNFGAPPTISDPNPPEVRSISEVIGRKVYRYGAFTTIVTQLIETTNELLQDPHSVIREFRKRCILTNQHVSFSMGEESRSGLCLGIDDDGALKVDVESKIHHVTSGEANLLRTKG